MHRYVLPTRVVWHGDGRAGHFSNHTRTDTMLGLHRFITSHKEPGCHVSFRETRVACSNSNYSDIVRHIISATCTYVAEP